jgi:hypothetical protein
LDRLTLGDGLGRIEWGSLGPYRGFVQQRRIFTTQGLQGAKGGPQALGHGVHLQGTAQHNTTHNAHHVRRHVRMGRAERSVCGCVRLLRGQATCMCVCAQVRYTLRIHGRAVRHLLLVGGHALVLESVQGSFQPLVLLLGGPCTSPTLGKLCAHPGVLALGHNHAPARAWKAGGSVDRDKATACVC